LVSLNAPVQSQNHQQENDQSPDQFSKSGLVFKEDVVQALKHKCTHVKNHVEGMPKAFFPKNLKMVP
jgi:hypothetical protein